MKKLLILMLALAMMFSLAACGDNNPAGGNNPGGNTPGGNNNPSGNDPSGGNGDSAGGLINFDEEPYEVSIQLVGLMDPNNDIAAVEEALNAITVPKINCKVDIVPIFIGDMTNTALQVAGGEKLDIVAVGLINRLSNMVKDDVLLPLDDLLAERGPTVLEVTKDVAEAQKISGVTYAVSSYPYPAKGGGFVYNKTMADDWGIDMHDGMTYEDLSAAGEILKEHGIYLTTFNGSAELNFRFFNGGEYFGGSSGEYGAILDPSVDTEVINIYDSQEMRDYWKAVKSWNDAGYLPVGQLTETTRVAEFFQQQYLFGTSTDYAAGQLAMYASSAFEPGIVCMSEPLLLTDRAAEYMLGIAANCKRPDKAMDLINLIYEDAEVSNLLQYGVEGLDYVAVEGTQNVITRTGTSNEDMSGYYTTFSLYGDPMKQKIMQPLTDSLYDEMKELASSARKSMAFGYSFNSADFSAEIAAINNVLLEKLPALNAGEVDDVDKAVDDLVAALKTAGIDNVIAANQEQLNAFLGK